MRGIRKRGSSTPGCGKEESKAVEAIHRGAELRRLARWVLADLLLFAAGGLWLQARGQNDGRMHQYMFSQQDFNPSFAGSQGLIDVYTLFRQQWVGYGKGAPQLLFLNFDVPFNYKTAETMTPGKKMEYSHGVGLHFERDAIGFSTQYGVELAYSGRFHLRGLGALAIGVGFRAINDRFKAEWNATDSPESDPAIPRAEQSSVTFDLSAGLYYNTPNLYFGISAQNLLGEKVRGKLDPNGRKKGSGLGYAREYYVVSGYNVDLPRRWSVQPSVLYRTDLVQHQLGATFTAMYNQMVWFGVSYYVVESVGVLVGVNLLNGLRIGYLYDWPTSLLGRNTSGSHEVLLGYSFNMHRERDPKRYRSIRFLY